MKLFCQLFLVGCMVLSFLARTWVAVNGRPKAEPSGFPGVLGVTIAIAITALVYWQAGAFSELLK